MNASAAGSEYVGGGPRDGEAARPAFIGATDYRPVRYLADQAGHNHVYRWEYERRLWVYEGEE